MHSASADSLNTLTKSPQQKSLLIHRFWHVDIVALHPRIQDPGIRIQKEPRSYPALIPFTRLTKSASANGPHIQCEPLRRLNRREFSSLLHRGELRHRDCFRSETNGDSLNTPQAKAAFSSRCWRRIALRDCSASSFALRRRPTVQNQHIFCPDSRFCVFSRRPRPCRILCPAGIISVLHAHFTLPEACLHCRVQACCHLC